MENTRLYALCAYGLDPAASADLMRRYGNEDEIPLNEFDTTEFRRAEDF